MTDPGLVTKDPKSPARLADKISRRRGRLLLFQALLFIVWQATFFSWDADSAEVVRSVDQVKISAWAVWATALLIMLATGGAWIYSREVRRLVNDESSVFNRHAGQRAGFFAASIAALAVYLVNLFVEPISTLDTVHAVLTAGIGVALLRYALLERKGERGV